MVEEAVIALKHDIDEFVHEIDFSKREIALLSLTASDSNIRGNVALQLHAEISEWKGETDFNKGLVYIHSPIETYSKGRLLFVCSQFRQLFNLIVRERLCRPSNQSKLKLLLEGIEKRVEAFLPLLKSGCEFREDWEEQDGLDREESEDDGNPFGDSGQVGVAPEDSDWNVLLERLAGNLNHTNSVEELGYSSSDESSDIDAFEADWNRADIVAERDFALEELIASNQAVRSVEELKKVREEDLWAALETLKLTYFNVKAGLFTLDEFDGPLDEFGNPTDLDCDLGKPGAFSEFQLVVYTKYTPERLGETDAVYNNFLNALRQIPRFEVIQVFEDESFMEMLEDPSVDQAWIISCGINSTVSPKLGEACRRFVQSMRGIAIFADNAPLIADANAVLSGIYGIDFDLYGSDPGEKVLEPVFNDRNPGFKPHLITTGIKTLYEGHTLSYPFNSKALKESGMKVLALNSSEHPVIMFDDPPVHQGRGRVLLDCGFTKLWDPYWKKTAGTDRYIRNAAVWLLGLEKRTIAHAPLKGPVYITNPHPAA